MITITESAQKKIAELIEKSENPVKGLRIGAESVSPLKVDFKMAFIAAGQDTQDDEVVNFATFDVYLDADSLPHLEEAKVVFVDVLMGSGFKIERGSKLPTNLSGPLVEKVQQVIQEQVNPAVANHGGHISLIDIKEDVVYVQLGGGCQGCGLADVTLKQGIEAAIKEAVPEITAVYDVTDHANGENPYYQSSQ